MNHRPRIGATVTLLWAAVVLLFPLSEGKTSDAFTAEGNRLKAEGDAFFRAGENASAKDRYEKALLIYRKAHYPEGEGRVYVALGDIHLRTGNNSKAEEMYGKALSLFQKTHSPEGEGTVYTGLGNVSLRRRDYPQAMEMYRNALIYFEKMHSLNHQGYVYRHMGEIFMRTGNNATAREHYEKALALFTRSGDSIGRGSALRSMGEMYYYVGNNAKAMELFHMALLPFQEGKYPHGEADVFRRMGQIYLRMGDYENALETLQEKALPRYLKIEDPVGQADVYKDVGDIFYYCRDYAKALERYDKALPLYRKVNDTIGLGNVYRSMGDISMRTGDNKRAADLYMKAQELYQRAASPIGLGNVYHSLGDIHLMEKNLKSAREMYQTALLFYEKANALMGQGNSYRGLGEVSFAKGSYREASEMYNRALSFFRRSNSAYGQGRTYQSLGEIELALGNPEKALEMFDRSVEIYRRTEDIELEAYALFRKAAVLRAQGRKNETLSLYEIALSRLEKVRRQALFSELKKGFMEKAYDHYEEAAVFMLENDLLEKAFRTMEAMKARTFLDQLSEGRMDLHKGIDTTLRGKRDEIENSITLLQKLLTEEVEKPRPDEGRIAELRNKLAGEDDKLEAVKREIHLKNPLYSSVQYPDPISIKELQRNILKEDESLIEYFLTRDGVYCFVIDRRDARVQKLAPTKDTVEKRVESFLRNIQETVKGSPFDSQGAMRLYEELVKPIGEPTGGKTLIVVPHGILALLPFEALLSPMNGHQAFLIEKYRIKYIQSASVLGMLRTHYVKEGVTDHFLGFGDPVYDFENYRRGEPEVGDEVGSDRSASRQWRKTGYLRAGGRLNRLVGSGREVKEIGDIFRKKQLSGKTLCRIDAREENAKSKEMEHYGYIHFSAHGILTPHFQAIALSHIPESREDGFLTLGEIMNSRFNAHLVVLSACETGLGRIERGEGVTGLTRAVMYAGSPAAVVSLWSVSDEGTEKLMVRFYRNLMEKGMEKEEALRQAKIEMLTKETADPHGETVKRDGLRSVSITRKFNGESFHHPFYWAAFVMYGE